MNTHSLFGYLFIALFSLFSCIMLFDAGWSHIISVSGAEKNNGISLEIVQWLFYNISTPGKLFMW